MIKTFKIPRDMMAGCQEIDAAAAEKNRFEAVSFIFQKNGTERYYEYLNKSANAKHLADKKPTGPGKKKAVECFKRIKDKSIDVFPDHKLVCAKIVSQRHGVFVLALYESCPIDIIEYLISERI